MRVRFNGIVEKRTSGCRPCGKQRGDSVFVRSKLYFLPSGRSITFRTGTEEDVSDADGEFLLSYQYISPDGTIKKAFEVVNG